MKISSDFKDKINNCVVRIIAEDININWNIPFIIEEPSKGQGSGFFIDKNGNILTCAHVVNGAKNVYIEIPSLGSDKYECEIVSICPTFDIALIKCINYKSKNYLDLGNSDKLDVGMEVMVVGYPASYTKKSRNSNNLKFTTGIIKGQQLGMIETDSAINPGNSGGPLFCNNKIIGINSMKLVSESLENIGYAIPINNYKIIKDSFKEKIIYRPNLLFEYSNTNKDIVNGLTGKLADNGIIISKIFEGSPFKGTDIKKDTIITKIDNMSIDNYGLIENYKWLDSHINIDTFLNKFKNNETIKINYFNNNKSGSCSIKLKPLKMNIRIMYPLFEEIPFMIIGGMILMNLTMNHLFNYNKNDLSMLCIANNREELLKDHLIVSFIFPNTKINILNNIVKNDLICKVNEIKVSSIDELKKALKKPIIINNKEYIKFEEKDGKSIIMLLEDLIKEDLIFSKKYNYPLNEFHKKVLNK